MLESDEGGFVLDIPDHLSRNEMDRLTSELAAADRARDPDALTKAMGSQIRDTADRVDGVGKGLMINRLPRASLTASAEVTALAGGVNEIVPQVHSVVAVAGQHVVPTSARI